MSVEHPFDVVAFREAVHDWFVTATDLDAVWRFQAAPQPPMPFASLKIIAGPVPASPQSELDWNYSALRAAGREIELTTKVPCSVTVSCQVFVDQPDARLAGWDACQYLSKARASLNQEWVRDILWPHRIAVISTGALQDLSELVGSRHISRANLDVVFGVTLGLTESVTFIERVHGQSVNLGIDELFG